MSWHATVYLLVAGIAFLTLIAACFVFARLFAAAGRRETCKDESKAEFPVPASVVAPSSRPTPDRRSAAVRREGQISRTVAR